MKKMFLCPTTLILPTMALVLALAHHAEAEDAVPASAKVTRVRGQARYTTDGKNWQKPKVGDPLPAGTLIQTARSNSSVDIQLSETPTGVSTQGTGGQTAAGDVVHLFENTVLGIKKVVSRGEGSDRVAQIELDLRTGQVQGTLQSSSSESSCEIEFPGGLVGTRGNLSTGLGTVFLLKSSGALSVFAGKVVVSLAKENAVPQVVVADQQFDPATGQVTALAKQSSGKQPTQAEGAGDL